MPIYPTNKGKNFIDRFKPSWNRESLHSLVYLNPFKFLDKCLGFRLELVDEFTKIVLNAFGHFIEFYQVLPFRARVGLVAMEMKGCSAFPRSRHHWNLTIRLFRVLSWTLGFLGVGRSYPSPEGNSVYSKAPADWAKREISHL